MSIPLKAIHYFVEVARAQSFSQASSRLHVSQSAVSHQIKHLESYLDTTLFVRSGRAIRLTAMGELYFQQVASPLQDIEQATINVKQRDTRRVRLALHGSLAVKWLIPALDDFRQRYPNIDLSLQLLTHDGWFDEQWADCFVTTMPPTKGYQRYHLYDEKLRPYCSAQLWERARAIRHPQELAEFPLLSATSAFASNQPGEDWRRWFQAANMEVPSWATMHHFSHLLLAAEAAKYGQGIALLNEFMTTKDEREHHLFELPLQSIRTDDSFYFVYPDKAHRRSALDALGTWLVDLCQARQ